MPSSVPAGGAKAKTGEKQNKYALYVFGAVCAVLLVCTAIFLRHLSLWINLCAYAVILTLLICAFTAYFLKKTALFRLCITTTASFSFILAGYIILDTTGVFNTLSDIELIRNFVLSTGIWGRFVFVALQIAQVVFLPVPAALVSLTGVMLYGPMQGFILSFIGIIIGSVIAFTAGKVFGKKLVSWIAGKENAEKYRKMFDKKGRFIFILMLVFPIFPDDMLCMVAGITAMDYGYFSLAVLLSRPWGLAATCFLGSGEIIPFRGWGIAVWAVIIVVLAAAFFLMNKYNDKITAFFNGLAKKLGKRTRAKTPSGLLAEAADIEPGTKIFAAPKGPQSSRKQNKGMRA